MPSGFSIISSVLSLVVYSVVLFAVYKVFQIATDVGEMKEILRDIRRNTSSAAPVVPQSPESLVRAVNAASYSDIIEDAIRSEQPR